MKEIYFDCPRKKKTLALIFEDLEDITADNLRHLIDCKADRYIKLIYKKGELMTYGTMIKFEFKNDAILEEEVSFLRNDMEDLVKIVNLAKI